MRVFEYVQQGGPIMYLLLTLNAVGVAIMIFKFVSLSAQKKRTNETTDTLKTKITGVHAAKNLDVLVEISKKELNSYMGGLERGLNTVKIIATVSPLLGLLGTVVGVFMAFQVMAESGLGNPASFAQGISVALITTVGGLIVAIPHYIGHSYLNGILDDIEGTLEKDLLSKIL